MLLLLSHFSHVQLCVIPQTAATRLPRPWDSPGKNTGVGCHFLLQCRKVKSEREVAQSCLTFSDPMDYSLPGSSIHGIFQAKYWSRVPLPLRKYINIRVKFCAVVCKQEFKKKKHNGILYCYRTYLCISKFLSLAYWVFLKLQGLFLVSLSNGYSSLGYMGFSLQWLLLRWSTGSRAGRLSSCVALA